MSYESAFMRDPLTRVDYPTDKTVAEFSLLGPQVAPTAIADPNVYPIPMVVQATADATKLRQKQIPETEEVWQLKFRITGPTASSTDGYVIPWVWDRHVEQFHFLTKIPLIGIDNVSTTVGAVRQLPGVLGVSHIGFEVSGLAAGDTVHITHEAA